jgi:5'-methylthioadenosine phosphorylase
MEELIMPKTGPKTGPKTESETGSNAGPKTGPKIGIIGGSGFYDLPGVRILREVDAETPFGKPSDVVKILDIGGRHAAFITRHGKRHDIPPHRVNYRANIRAMKDLGVSAIFAVGAVGGINADFKSGDIVIVDQVIDMTKGRAGTFYDGGDVYHVDFTEPYCGQLRRAYLEAALVLGFGVHDGGTYVCTEGPRLESRAEIRVYKAMGADVVGMTGMPEAALARELEICYSTAAVVTNPAAGISNEPLTATEVLDNMKKSSERLNALLLKALSIVSLKRGCPCASALKEAKC